MKKYLNKIIQGDALEVLKGMPDECVDLVLTDPPYNLKGVGNLKQKGDLQETNFGEWDKDFTPKKLLSECRRVLKSEGSVVIFCSDRLLLDYYPLLRNEWNYKATITWHKTNPAPSFRKVNYISSCEFILWAVNKRLEKCDYTFNFSQQKDMHNFVETPICGGKERTEHPTQKPLILISKLLRVHSNRGDLVLDPFLGSGTTAVAAKQLDRNFIGIEINPNYCEIARGRLRQDNLF